MYCRHCGMELTDNARFCRNCGNPVNAAPFQEQHFRPSEEDVRTAFESSIFDSKTELAAVSAGNAVNRRGLPKPQKVRIGKGAAIFMLIAAVILIGLIVYMFGFSGTGSGKSPAWRNTSSEIVPSSGEQLCMRL